MADPTPPTDFSALRLLTAEQLVQLGCVRWNETLVLFPASWASAIPEGFEVTSVTGKTERFSKKWPKAKLDRRLGLLAFGIAPCPKEFAPTVTDQPEWTPPVEKPLGMKGATGYPASWPMCAAGCGLRAMDGHATCGQVGCNEAAHR